jgi:hypothetical protein
MLCENSELDVVLEFDGGVPLGGGRGGRPRWGDQLGGGRERPSDSANMSMRCYGSIFILT